LIAAPTPTVIPPPARVQVVAQEFRYALSRQTIKAGRAIVELRNLGQDTHDLVLQRADGSRVVLRWPAAAPGAVIDRAITLKPGLYRFVCTVANHRALGMQALLRVRR
jgi:plastocyanin